MRTARAVAAVAGADADATSVMPQAILLQDHEQLGSRGTVVDVSKGYLRNYLIPRKLAEPATKGAIAAAARALQASERAAAQATQRAQDSAAVLSRTVLTIAHQAGDDGRLFGSVTAQDIVDAIKEARGIEIDRRKVHLEEPIRTVGTRMVDVEVEDGVTATIKTMVVEQK
jgi:large subunit ribosomal protein L9